jgi:protein-S-isoprenylcysteine O-methyltransferase Ste14
MHPNVGKYIDAVWIALLIVWLVGALTTKRTVRSQSVASRRIHGIPFLLALLLIFNHPPWFGPLLWRFVPQSFLADYMGLVLTIMGVVFAIWSRLYLGRNWSGIVTIKQDHKLIRTGPYALVRHPIYTGLGLAILGTAIAIGEMRGLVATGLVLVGMRLRSRLEEASMMEQFGAQYTHYKKDVRAMIPFVW